MYIYIYVYMCVHTAVPWARSVCKTLSWARWRWKLMRNAPPPLGGVVITCIQIPRPAP